MSDEKPSSAGGGKARKVVLFLILGLLLIALAYDYTVARPAVELAYNQIAERSVAVNADSTAKFTNLDVQQLMGREPGETFNDANGDRVEVYAWSGGLPLRSHKLYTVFKKNGDDFLFHRQVKGAFESSTDVSIYDGREPLVVDYSGLSTDGVAEEEDSGNTSPADPPNPEDAFTDADFDGDGLLKGDEIPASLSSNLASIDSDGDGAISLAELTDQMSGSADDE